MGAMLVVALAVLDAFRRRRVLFGVYLLRGPAPPHRPLCARCARRPRTCSKRAAAGGRVDDRVGLIIVAGPDRQRSSSTSGRSHSRWTIWGRLQQRRLACISRAFAGAARFHHHHRPRRVDHRDRRRRARRAGRGSDHRGLGIAVATALWWAYFDVVALVAEQAFRKPAVSPELARARHLRGYLHLPMVAGIVLFAFALKGVLAHVGDDLDVRVTALFGPALYLLAHDAMRFRASRTAQSAATPGSGSAARVAPGRSSISLAAVASAAAVCWASSAGRPFATRDNAFATPEIWCALSPPLRVSLPPGSNDVRADAQAPRSSPLARSRTRWRPGRRCGGRHAPRPGRARLTFDVRARGVHVGWYASVLRGAIHGSEIETVRIRIVPHSRISRLCATRNARSCYEGDERKGLVVVPAGRSADVAHMLLHEYAHHIDMARSNFLSTDKPWARSWWRRPVE